MIDEPKLVYGEFAGLILDSVLLTLEYCVLAIGDKDQICTEKA